MVFHKNLKKQHKLLQPPFPLSLADEGEAVRIVTIGRGRNIRERLLGMGIQVDDVVAVVQRRKKGAVLICKDENRYALRGGMAIKIHVIKEN